MSCILVSMTFGKSKNILSIVFWITLVCENLCSISRLKLVGVSSYQDSVGISSISTEILAYLDAFFI